MFPFLRARGRRIGECVRTRRDRHDRAVVRCFGRPLLRSLGENAIWMGEIISYLVLRPLGGEVLEKLEFYIGEES